LCSSRANLSNDTPVAGLRPRVSFCLARMDGSRVGNLTPGFAIPAIFVQARTNSSVIRPPEAFTRRIPRPARSSDRTTQPRNIGTPVDGTDLAEWRQGLKRSVSKPTHCRWLEDFQAASRRRKRNTTLASLSVKHHLSRWPPRTLRPARASSEPSNEGTHRTGHKPAAPKFAAVPARLEPGFHWWTPVVHART
jgi:hypothetical protein